mmetsp:Transcript_77805/g.224956  ORF Transcript_77805/g.224956 Transcript_77805/m.224956 type:complete len:247 (-) Transcript_77805:68-808(-)
MLQLKLRLALLQCQHDRLQILDGTGVLAAQSLDRRRQSNIFAVCLGRHSDALLCPGHHLLADSDLPAEPGGLGGVSLLLRVELRLRLVELLRERANLANERSPLVLEALALLDLQPVPLVESLEGGHVERFPQDLALNRPHALLDLQEPVGGGAEPVAVALDALDHGLLYAARPRVGERRRFDGRRRRGLQRPAAAADLQLGHLGCCRGCSGRCGCARGHSPPLWARPCGGVAGDGSERRRLLSPQ